MEKIWDHIFITELQIVPTEYPVLIIKPPLNPKINREKATQIILEIFKIPVFSLGVGAVLVYIYPDVQLDCRWIVAMSLLILFRLIKNLYCPIQFFGWI